MGPCMAKSKPQVKDESTQTIPKPQVKDESAQTIPKPQVKDESTQTIPKPEYSRQYCQMPIHNEPKLVLCNNKVHPKYPLSNADTNNIVRVTQRQIQKICQFIPFAKRQTSAYDDKSQVEHMKKVMVLPPKNQDNKSQDKIQDFTSTISNICTIFVQPIEKDNAVEFEVKKSEIKANQQNKGKSDNGQLKDLQKLMKSQTRYAGLQIPYIQIPQHQQKDSKINDGFLSALLPQKSHIIAKYTPQIVEQVQRHPLLN